MLFVNIHSDAGKIIQDMVDFEFSPTFIIYNASGEEVLRENSLPSVERLTAIFGR